MRMIRYMVTMVLLTLALSPVAISQNKTTYDTLFDSTQREKWYQLSVVNNGNPASIRQVMEKARQGQPVTIAVIGGSITAGRQPAITGLLLMVR